MNSLSLSPRLDLFSFKFPKDFLPDEINEKYAKILNKEKNVIISPIDYLNESIQGVTMPGLQNLLVEQQQHSPLHPANIHPQKGLAGARVSIEPERVNQTYSPANILSQIGGELKVTFRRNQGLYNYLMLYETAFYKCLKQYASNDGDRVFVLNILDETGLIIGRIQFFDPRIDNIDGIEFSYNKLDRQPDTFDIAFKYNNIDFDLV